MTAMPCLWEFSLELQELQFLPHSPWVPASSQPPFLQVQAKERGAAASQRSPLSNGPSAAGWITEQMRGCRAAVPQTALSCLTLPCNTTCEHSTAVLSGSGTASAMETQLLCLNMTPHVFCCCFEEIIKRKCLITAEPGGEYESPRRTQALLANTGRCCGLKADLGHTALCSKLS